MKIRTLNSTSATVSAGLALFIAAALIYSVTDVRESNALAKAADELTRDIWQIRLLIVRTTIGGEALPASEWRARHDSLRRTIDSTALSSPRVQDRVDRIRSDDANLDLLYSRLTAARAGAEPPATTQSGYAAQRAQIADALLSSTQTMFGDAFQIVRESQDRIDMSQERALVLFLTLLAMIALMAVIMWRLVRERVLAPIVDLQRGTERIAAGILDHRVGIGRHDEIGALSSSFDRMTQQLQVARTNLETEVAERRQSAEQLQTAEASLRALNEQLERHVKERTTELEAALREQRASERYYRMLFEGNPHPMWVYDFETFAFLAVNDAAIKQYGYTREEFLSMTIMDIRPPEDRDSLLSILRTIDLNTSRVGSHRHRRKDGRIIDVDVAADGIEFAGRRARLVLANNVTSRKRAEAQIHALTANLERMVEERTAQLEAANRELEAFSYSVSHDLRAPLRHIDGYADLLREDCEQSLSESGRRYLGVISDSVKRMGQLIDDLLTFSRMGRVEMHKTRVRMDQLVQEVLKELGEESGGRAIEWNVDPLPETAGDRAMLRQVWTNLLSNAIKYTRSRHPARIRVGCKQVDATMTEFFVQDNGTGFDMKYAGKLFNVFQRLHRADEFEGTGVGLANVRRIVTRHGGQTRAEARAGEGATFYFTLPDK